MKSLCKRYLLFSSILGQISPHPWTYHLLHPRGRCPSLVPSSSSKTRTVPPLRPVHQGPPALVGGGGVELQYVVLGTQVFVLMDRW